MTRPWAGLEGVLPFQRSSPLRLSTGGTPRMRSVLYLEGKGGVPCPARPPYLHSALTGRVVPVSVGFVAETR